MPKFKNSFLVIFGRKVLPDRSLLIGQKLVENVKIQMRHFEYVSNSVRNIFGNRKSARLCVILRSAWFYSKRGIQSSLIVPRWAIRYCMFHVSLRTCKSH